MMGGCGKTSTPAPQHPNTTAKKMQLSCKKLAHELFCIILSFLTTTAFLQGADSTGTIKVQVLDAVYETMRLPTVKVTIEELNTSIRTNKDGICHFTKIPEGAYTIECLFMGYDIEILRNIGVTENCTTNVTIKMWQVFYPPIPIDLDTVDFGPDSLVDTTVCPIEVKLFVDMDTFSLGEQIVLWCEITNTARHPIFIVEPLIRSGYVENELTRSTLVVEDSEQKDIIRRVRFAGCISIYGKDIKLIYPNSIYKPFWENMILNKWFAIEKPGKYYISMHIKQNRRFLYKRIRQQVGIYFPNLDFFTNRLEITILP